jgi:hypothetical protein
VTSPKETTIDTRTVARRTVEIVRLDWPDGGVGYDVYEKAGGELTLVTEMESLDHIPDDEEVRGLLGVEPVDRYNVNDALAALASGFGVELDDEELNELTHHVADVLDGAPAAVVQPTVAPEPPIIQVGQVLEVAGIGRFRVTDDGLERASDGPTVQVLVEVGAVIKVQRNDTRFDLCLVEQDTDGEGEGEPTASLTELRLVG